MVYACLDPSTAIMEVAVHTGFHYLDVTHHDLIRFEIMNPADVHVVQASDVPNSNWLRPGLASKGQRDFGDGLLAKHKFLAIPSVISPHSWNLLFNPTSAAGAYSFVGKERFALDTRLNPP